MNPERISPTELKTLIQTEGPALTLVIAGDKNGSSRIETKAALDRLRKESEQIGKQAQSLVEAMADEALKAPGHTAILRSASVNLNFPVGPAVESIARIGKRFDARTLLSIADCQKFFYILALSQKRTRILECTQSSSGECKFPAGFATSLDEWMHTRKPDHVLDNRQAVGPSVGSMKGVMFGTSSDREDKPEYLLHFFSNIDKAVHAMLNGHQKALIPVAVEHELALYQRVNTYPRLVTPGVHGAPDGLHGADLHSRALEVLATDETDPRRRTLADFEKRVGKGHASVHVQEIIRAAHEGRVSHLFFQHGAHYDGTFNEATKRVKHHLDSLDHKDDLIETAAYETILHGGEAAVAPASMMPNGVAVCAIFRYAEANSSTESVSTASQVSA